MAKTNAELTKELQSTVDELTELKKINDNLTTVNSGIIDDNDTLHNENAKLQKLIDDSIEFVENGVEVGEPITRTDIIKAMLPQIRLLYARPDTQRLMRSVDEVLETINA